MTDEEKQRLRELCEKASPGPWRVYRCNGDRTAGWRGDALACGIKHAEQDPKDDDYQSGVVFDTNRDECCHMMSLADAALIAASRFALPALLSEIERLTKERDEWRSQVNAMAEVVAASTVIRRKHSDIFELSKPESDTGRWRNAIDAFHERKVGRRG